MVPDCLLEFSLAMPESDEHRVLQAREISGLSESRGFAPVSSSTPGNQHGIAAQMRMPHSSSATSFGFQELNAQLKKAYEEMAPRFDGRRTSSKEDCNTTPILLEEP